MQHYDAFYRNFEQSLKADATKKQYDFYLQKYIKFIGGIDNLLRQNEIRLIESQIIDYIVDLKSNHNSWSYMSGNLSAIMHFYIMNDIVLNQKKISMFTGAKIRANKNTAYTTEQIAKVLEFCDDRTKLIILLFASTGIRLAALPALKFGDFRFFPFPGAGIHEITVYAGYKEEYITFCTPECARAINSYLNYRQRCGEELKPDTPLIREQFDINDSFRIKNPKHISKSNVRQMIEAKLTQAGIRTIDHVSDLSKRSKTRKSVPIIHGFRKFFNTALMNADVHPSFKELLMGHSIKLDDVYYDVNSEKSRNKLLDEYSKAIDYLTINEENRLRQKVEQLTIEKTQMDKLQQEVDKIKILMKQSS
jgi:integrase